MFYVWWHWGQSFYAYSNSNVFRRRLFRLFISLFILNNSLQEIWKENSDFMQNKRKRDKFNTQNIMRFCYKIRVWVQEILTSQLWWIFFIKDNTYFQYNIITIITYLQYFKVVWSRILKFSKPCMALNMFLPMVWFSI